MPAAEELIEVGEVGPKIAEGVREFFSESANRKLIERSARRRREYERRARRAQEHEVRRHDIRLHRHPRESLARRSRSDSSPSHGGKAGGIGQQENQLRGRRHRPRLQIRQSQDPSASQSSTKSPSKNSFQQRDRRISPVSHRRPVRPLHCHELSLLRSSLTKWRDRTSSLHTRSRDRRDGNPASAIPSHDTAHMPYNDLGG